MFDFGEWRSPVASRHNPDGSTSFVLIAPGLRGRALVAGDRDGKRTLTIRDGQHEYVFVERGGSGRPGAGHRLHTIDITPADRHVTTRGCAAPPLARIVLDPAA